MNSAGNLMKLSSEVSAFYQTFGPWVVERPELSFITFTGIENILSKVILFFKSLLSVS